MDTASTAVLSTRALKQTIESASIVKRRTPWRYYTNCSMAFYIPQESNVYTYMPSVDILC